MKKEDRISQILAVTLELLITKPIAEIRTLEIARAAGISEGTLFKYFSTKDEIFESIIARYVSHQHPLRAVSEIQTVSDFRQFIDEYLSSMISIHPERIAYLRLLLQISLIQHPLAKSKYAQTMQGFWRIMEDRIEYGKRHWSFDPAFNTKIQIRLFHLAVLMFVVEQEIFHAKEQDPHDLIEMKEEAINNLFKLLSGSKNG
ncbi:MAG: TetR/AcrR family transcriptional regulator [FCB group bacterium]|nr:TetR/AcrR family transcriptional regulator [FCB group bacterium]